MPACCVPAVPASGDGAPLATALSLAAPNRMFHCWRKQLEIQREPLALGTCPGRQKPPASHPQHLCERDLGWVTP